MLLLLQQHVDLQLVLLDLLHQATLPAQSL
jgi:hypothetical protein